MSADEKQKRLSDVNANTENQYYFVIEPRTFDIVFTDQITNDCACSVHNSWAPAEGKQ